MIRNKYPDGGRSDSGAVSIHKSDGSYRILKATANTDAARGALLATAQVAASSGDTIFVENPGTYQISGPLGKNGVNWHFAAGVTVYCADSEVFKDTGGMTFTVTGSADFKNDGGAPHLIEISNAASNVTLYGRSFWCNSSAGFAAVALYVDNGATAKIYASEYIKSSDYDGIWIANGICEIYTPFVSGVDHGLESSHASSNVIAQCQRIHGDSNPFEISAGTVRFIGAKMTGGNGGICSSSNITLENCSVEVTGSNSLTSAGAQKVTIVGSLSMNKPVHANIELLGYSYSGKRVGVLSADQNLSNSTLTDANNMKFPISANKTYRFRGLLIVSNPGTTAGFKLAASGPAAPTAAIMTGFLQNSTSSVLHQPATSLTTIIASGISTTGVKYVIVEGVIINGANAGDLKLQIAQNTTDAVNVTVLKAGSYFEVEQVAG
jgi:hypothetical protein